MLQNDFLGALHKPLLHIFNFSLKTVFVHTKSKLVELRSSLKALKMLN